MNNQYFKTSLWIFILPATLFYYSSAFAKEPLSLARAIEIAEKNHPALLQALNNIEAAHARANQSRASLLPSLQLSTQYQKQTANFAPRPGSVPSQLQSNNVSNSFNTYDFLNLGLQANLFTLDSGQSIVRFLAARSTQQAQIENEKNIRLDIIYQVEIAYLGLLAQQAYVQANQENLNNLQRHETQVKKYIDVGLKTEIDWLQVKAEAASAKLQLITAKNAEANQRTQLLLCMGILTEEDQDPGFELTDTLSQILKKTSVINTLSFVRMIQKRPDLITLDNQITAQAYTQKAALLAHFPTLNLSTGISYAGQNLNAMAFNWNIQVGLSWNIFQGLQHYSQYQESQATLQQLKGQRQQLIQKARFEIEQASRATSAAEEEIKAAEEAQTHAQRRLVLAESRYQQGVGNMIELNDARQALFNTASQLIKAHYNWVSALALHYKTQGDSLPLKN